MVRAKTIHVALCALCFVAIGCIYTDPINVAPRITDVVGPKNLLRGDAADYTVTAVDDDGDTLSFEWAMVPGACPQQGLEEAFPADSAARAGIGTKLAFGPAKSNTVGSLCVWVKATDRHGAFDVANLEARVDNRKPSVVLKADPQAAAYDLYTQFRIMAVIEDDDDLSTFVDGDKLKFTLTRPDGTTMSDVACAGAVSSACFFADVPGRWTLGASVTDPQGATAEAAPMAFEVMPDRLPCIRPVRPHFDPRAELPVSETERVALEVSVDDDGDPFPARDRPSKAVLTWWYKLPGSTAFERLPEVNRNPFELPTFRLGDVVEVRVEARDRNNADIAESTCKDEGRHCEASAGCPQRITWRLSYSL